MRSQFSNKQVNRTTRAETHQWYEGFDDEQFIHSTNGGWFVESREGEFGPFQSQKDAEDFYYSRFRH